MMSKAVMNWLRVSLDAVRTSLWVVPGLMFLCGAALAAGMLQLEPGWSAKHLGRGWWTASGNGEDARNLLSVLLTSVITMASMAFSVTVVALSLAANTYGPRLIRMFRANRVNQFVLGVFILTIVYLLLVLQSVQGNWEPARVPHAAVSMGSILALASVLALLAFIQGVASSISASEVVLRVRKELDTAITELPTLQAQDKESSSVAEDFDKVATLIRLPREGYVQSIEYGELVEWASRRGVVIKLDFRPGDFVVEGDRKVLVHPCPDDSEQVRKQIQKFIVSGQHRTPTQDIEYAIRHLVEVAVRALSPGVNDPFTAMAVIDRLRGGLARLAKRQMPPETLQDQSGTTRIIRRVTTFAGAVDAAIDQIRQAGSEKPAILIHLLEAIGGVAAHTAVGEQRAAFARHASLIRAAGLRDLKEPADREDLELAFKATMCALS
jgi:uncharacterized membrane protein